MRAGTTAARGGPSASAPSLVPRFRSGVGAPSSLGAGCCRFKSCP
jgi:hypothetical protein